MSNQIITLAKIRDTIGQAQLRLLDVTVMLTIEGFIDWQAKLYKIKVDLCDLESEILHKQMEAIKNEAKN